MRIGKWPCFVATFTLCVLLLQRCSRVEPPPADDVKPLERRYAELHARTLAAAARQHAEMCRVRGATALTDPSGLLGLRIQVSDPSDARRLAWSLASHLHSLEFHPTGATAQRGLTSLMQVSDGQPNPNSRPNSDPNLTQP